MRKKYPEQSATPSRICNNQLFCIRVLYSVDLIYVNNNLVNKLILKS